MFIHSTHKKDLRTPKALSKVSAGFTLVEMVIVIAIIGIMTSLVMVSFGDQRTKKELETNAREFASVLKEAQNYALTGRQINGSIVCRFEVSWIASASSYSLSAVPKSGTGVCGTAIPIASHPLRQGVVFSTAASTISFSLPWASSSATTIRFGKSDLFHTVCLNASGKIIDYAGADDCSP